MNSSNAVYPVMRGEGELNSEELGQQALLFDSTANQQKPTQHLIHRLFFSFKIHNTGVHEYMHCLGG